MLRLTELKASEPSNRQWVLLPGQATITAFESSTTVPISLQAAADLKIRDIAYCSGLDIHFPTKNTFMRVWWNRVESIPVMGDSWTDTGSIEPF